MAAAGLIDRTPEPERLCLLGRILSGEETNSDGLTLPADDAAWLVAEFGRHPKRGRRTWLMKKLGDAGFAFSHYTVDTHLLATRCTCPDSVPLRGANA